MTPTSEIIASTQQALAERDQYISELETRIREMDEAARNAESDFSQRVEEAVAGAVNPIASARDAIAREFQDYKDRAEASERRQREELDNNGV